MSVFAEIENEDDDEAECEMTWWNRGRIPNSKPVRTDLTVEPRTVELGTLKRKARNEKEEEED